MERFQFKVPPSSYQYSKTYFPFLSFSFPAYEKTSLWLKKKLSLGSQISLFGQNANLIDISE